MTKRSPGQQKLIQAARLRGNNEIGELIGQASADDLDWFVQMMNYQLEETPNWIKDEEQLHDAQAWTRQIRIAASSVLHNKRVVANRNAFLRRIAIDLALVGIGALLGWGLPRLMG